MRQFFINCLMVICSVTLPVPTVWAKTVFEVDLREPTSQGNVTFLKDNLIKITSGQMFGLSGGELLYKLPSSLLNNKVYVVHAIAMVEKPYTSSSPWSAANLVCDISNRKTSYIRKLKATGDYEHYAFYVFLSSNDDVARIGVRIPRNINGRIRLKRLWVESYDSVDDTFPYALQGDESNKRLTATLEKNNAQNINGYLLGYNTILPRTRINFSSEVFQSVFRDFSPGAIRFPGGAFANYYDWRSDVIPSVPDYAPQFVKESVKYRERSGARRFGFQDLAGLTKDVRADMIIVLNISDIPLGSIVDWVKDIRSRGLKAKYFELGNEVYDEKQVSQSYRSPEKYVARAKEITALLKGFDPSIRVGIVARPLGFASLPSDSWNEYIAKYDFYDGIVVHTYNKEDGAAYDQAMKKSFLAPEAHVNEFLRYYGQIFGTAKPLWNTEWNVFNLYYTTVDFKSHGLGRPFKYTGPVLSMLHTAGYLISVLNNSERIEMAAMHAFGPSDDDFGFLDYYWDNDERLGLTYTYHGLRVFNRISAQSISHFPVSIMENAAPIAEGFSRVLARGFVGRDGVTRLLLLNKLPVAKSIDLFDKNKQITRFASHKYIGSGGLNDEISLSLGGGRPDKSVTTANGLILPPYSLNVVELKD